LISGGFLSRSVEIQRKYLDKRSENYVTYNSAVDSFIEVIKLFK